MRRFAFARPRMLLRMHASWSRGGSMHACMHACQQCTLSISLTILCHVYFLLPCLGTDWLLACWQGCWLARKPEVPDEGQQPLLKEDVQAKKMQ